MAMGVVIRQTLIEARPWNIWPFILASASTGMAIMAAKGLIDYH